jgi:hypothetical protein
MTIQIPSSNAPLGGGFATHQDVDPTPQPDDVAPSQTSSDVDPLTKIGAMYGFHKEARFADSTPRAGPPPSGTAH